MNRLALRRLGAAAVLAALAALGGSAVNRAGAEDPVPTASGWLTYRFPQPQPTCATGLVGTQARYWDAKSCGFGRVGLGGVATTAKPVIEFVAPDGRTLGSSPASYDTTNKNWTFDVQPAPAWPAGPIRLRARLGSTAIAGESALYVNQLGATAAPASGSYAPGADVPVKG